MVTLRRVPSGVAVIVFGNADEPAAGGSADDRRDAARSPLTGIRSQREDGREDHRRRGLRRRPHQRDASTYNEEPQDVWTFVRVLTDAGRPRLGRVVELPGQREPHRRRRHPPSPPLDRRAGRRGHHGDVAPALPQGRLSRPARAAHRGGERDRHRAVGHQGQGRPAGRSTTSSAARCGTACRSTRTAGSPPWTATRRARRPRTTRRPPGASWPEATPPSSSTRSTRCCPITRRTSEARSRPPARSSAWRASPRCGRRSAPEIEILIDAHGHYNVPTAVRLARRLEPYRIGWFEEPTPAREPGGAPGRARAGLGADLRRRAALHAMGLPAGARRAARGLPDAGRRLDRRDQRDHANRLAGRDLPRPGDAAQRDGTAPGRGRRPRHAGGAELLPARAQRGERRPGTTAVSTARSTSAATASTCRPGPVSASSSTRRSSGLTEPAGSAE